MARYFSYVSTLFFICVIYQSNAQLKVTCGTDIQMQKHYEVHPNSKAYLKSFSKKKTLTSKTNNAYVIPVVFHVFGTVFNENTTVTQEIIEDALKRTNEDFQGLTSDYNTVRLAFRNLRATLNVTFKLAKKDPDGNSTTGVIFHNQASGMGNYDSPIVPQVAWDNKKYVNVYITRDLYDDGDFLNSGVAWLPDVDMTNNNIARIVYNGSYLGDNTDENFRSVLTHEFGHFLGLHHTFHDGCVSDTSAGDEVADTPPHDDDSSGEGCFGRLNCLSQQINLENFMDYSDCYKMFTQGQVDRMVDFLENSQARNTLWTAQNLIDTGLEASLSVNNNDLFNINIFPNPTNNTLYIETPENKNLEITFFNILGKNSLQANYEVKNNTVALSLNTLPEGIYFIIGKQGLKRFTKKIIVKK